MAKICVKFDSASVGHVPSIFIQADFRGGRKASLQVIPIATHTTSAANLVAIRAAISCTSCECYTWFHLRPSVPQTYHQGNRVNTTRQDEYSSVCERPAQTGIRPVYLTCGFTPELPVCMRFRIRRFDLTHTPVYIQWFLPW